VDLFFFFFCLLPGFPAPLFGLFFGPIGVPPHPPTLSMAWGVRVLTAAFDPFVPLLFELCVAFPDAHQPVWRPPFFFCDLGVVLQDPYFFEPFFSVVPAVGDLLDGNQNASPPFFFGSQPSDPSPSIRFETLTC